MVISLHICFSADLILQPFTGKCPWILCLHMKPCRCYCFCSGQLVDPGAELPFYQGWYTSSFLVFLWRFCIIVNTCLCVCPCRVNFWTQTWNHLNYCSEAISTSTHVMYRTQVHWERKASVYLTLQHAIRPTYCKPIKKLKKIPLKQRKILLSHLGAPTAR